MSRSSISSASGSDDLTSQTTSRTTPPGSPYVRPAGIRQKLRAVMMRSGTSKGIFLHLSDLPEDRDEWGPVLCAAMGSPDPFLKQLDGVGGGVSTQSKVAVISPSSDPRADVDYLFVQVPIDGTELDFSGNCGNMASGVGPFAVEEGLVKVNTTGPAEVTVRIRNVNTDRFIHSTFATIGQLPVETGPDRLDGVSGSGAPIRLDFMDPAGSMTGSLLPTGTPQDIITLQDSRQFVVSCVDAANPFVFVPLEQFGLDGAVHLADLSNPTIVTTLMEIRARASLLMGITSDLGVAALQLGTPKIALIGQGIEGASDISVYAYSMGKPHPTIQMTGAVCIGAASAIPGTVINEIVNGKQDIVIRHLTGLMTVRGEAVCTGSQVDISSGSVYRTARRLMEGNICIS